MIALSLGLKIPFDSLSSHRPFKLISLPPATNSEWYQRGINAAGHPLLCKLNGGVCSACSFCCYVISILPQLLQHPDNKLGQFKIL